MTERKKKRFTDGWTEIQKDRKTEGQRDRLIINREEEFANGLNKKYWQRELQMDRQRDRKTKRKKNREKERKNCRWLDREPEKHKDRMNDIKLTS